MIQVTITNINGTTFVGTADTQADLEAWITQEEANNSWGKPERSLVAGPDGTVPGEDITKAISSQEITNPDGSTSIEYTFSAEYTIGTPVDITTQLAQAKAIQDSLGALSFGTQVLASVRAASLVNNSTPDQMDAMTKDATLNQILNALGTGAINTAHDLIKGLPTTYFTQDQINSIVSMIEGSTYYTPTPSVTTTTSS